VLSATLHHGAQCGNRLAGKRIAEMQEYKGGGTTVDDCYNTSHDFAVKCTFASGVEMTVESRGDNGILFEGSKGRLFVNRGKITGTPIDENRDKDQFGPEQLSELYKGKPFEGHKNNFYRCIGEGGLPVSDVYSHLQVMNTCHCVWLPNSTARSGAHKKNRWSNGVRPAVLYKF